MKTRTQAAGPELQPAAKASERRATVRYPCNAATSCLVPFAQANDRFWPATVRDISLHGLGLLVGRWFGQGTLLEVELNQAGGNAPGSLIVFVKHSTPQGDGDYLVGCTFLSKFTQEELKDWLEGPSRGDSPPVSEPSANAGAVVPGGPAG